MRVRVGLELIEEVLGEDVFEGGGSTGLIGVGRSGQVRSSHKVRVTVNRGYVRRGYCRRGCFFLGGRRKEGIPLT